MAAEILPLERVEKFTWELFDREEQAQMAAQV